MSTSLRPDQRVRYSRRNTVLRENVSAHGLGAPVCEYCGYVIDGTPEMDHIVPLARDEEFSDTPLDVVGDLNNIAVTCRACNGEKGDQDLSDFLEARGYEWTVIEMIQQRLSSRNLEAK